MYASQQMLRANHDEWLRYAETRRQIKQATAASRGSSPTRRPGRRPLGLLRGHGLRRPVNAA